MARRKQVRGGKELITSFKEFPPDHLDQVALLAGQGLSDREMAEVMGVSVKKLQAWRMRYQDFDEAIAKGRLRIDLEVHRALYKRAVGYAYEKESVEDGIDGVTTRRDVVVVPPDVGAIKFWLTNRTESWKDKKEVEVNVNLVDRLTRAVARVGARVIEGRIVHDPTPPEAKDGLGSAVALEHAGDGESTDSTEISEEPDLVLAVLPTADALHE